LKFIIDIKLLSLITETYLESLDAHSVLPMFHAYSLHSIPLCVLHAKAVLVLIVIP
jgi:hypothetical protein